MRTSPGGSSELAAYRAARIHLVAFPGQATRDQLLEALDSCLRDICTAVMARRPAVWRVRKSRGAWILSQL